jgi:hypothetical protein
MEFTGLTWGAQEQMQVQQLNNKNVQHKFGVHKYSLDDFKLSKEEVLKAFDFYYEKFNLKND